MTDRGDPSFRPMTADDCHWNEVLTFKCGDDPWHEEVAVQLRSCEVWRVRKTQTMKTRLYCYRHPSDQLIGFASSGRKQITGTDHDGVEFTGRTQLIAWFAVGEQFQGQRPGGRHADNMLAELAMIAINEGLAGFSAFINTRNERAIRFWTGRGFVRNVNHPTQEDNENSYDLYYLPFPSDIS